MTNPKVLVGSFTLILALAVSAFAGDISTPPCAPGDISTPPCSSGQVNTEDPIIPIESETAPEAESVVIGTVAEAALGAFLSVF